MSVAIGRNVDDRSEYAPPGPTARREGAMATEVVRVEASGGRPGWTAGRRRAVVGLALTGWLLFVGIATVTLVVEAANHRADFSDLANAIGFLAFASMGALLATRLPTNAVGWTLLVVALAAILNRAISAYLAAAVQSDLPAEALIAWVDSWMWAVSLGTAMIVLPVVFPDGRVPRGRLRALIWAMVAVFVVAPVFVASRPGRSPGCRRSTTRSAWLSSSPSRRPAGRSCRPSASSRSSPAP
jgi:hypothetical protein